MLLTERRKFISCYISQNKDFFSAKRKRKPKRKTSKDEEIQLIVHFSTSITLLRKITPSHEFQWTLRTRSKTYLKDKKIEKKRHVLGGGRTEWKKEFWGKIAKGNLERAKRNYRLFQVRGWWVRVKDDKGKGKCIKWINWAVFPIKYNPAHFSHRKEMN